LRKSLRETNATTMNCSRYSYSTLISGVTFDDHSSFSEDLMRQFTHRALFLHSARRILFAIALAAFAGGCATMQATSTTLLSRDSQWFVFLERGKPTPPDTALVAKMQSGHLANFGRLFSEKKLSAAGPINEPNGRKRGIVVVSAPNKDVLQSYFASDQYVKDGYLTLNARRAVAQRAFNTTGIDANNIEELRIIVINRAPVVLDSDSQRNADAFLQTLVDAGVVGAWYKLEDGPVAEVLFARGTDTLKFKDIMAQHPSAAAMGQEINVWTQWLSKGMVN
jgi:uncharacterized protein YciI